MENYLLSDQTVIPFHSQASQQRKVNKVTSGQSDEEELIALLDRSVDRAAIFENLIESSIMAKRTDRAWYWMRQMSLHLPKML